VVKPAATNFFRPLVRFTETNHMNNNTKARMKEMRRTNPSYFKTKPRVRPGHKGKVGACGKRSAN